MAMGTAWAVTLTKRAVSLHSRVLSIFHTRKGVIWGLLTIVVIALSYQVRRRIGRGRVAAMASVMRILKALSDLVVGSMPT